MKNKFEMPENTFYTTNNLTIKAVDDMKKEYVNNNRKAKEQIKKYENESNKVTANYTNWTGGVEDEK